VTLCQEETEPAYGNGSYDRRGAGFAQVLPFQVMQIQSVTDLDSNGDEALGECFMRPVCQGGTL